MTENTTHVFSPPPIVDLKDETLEIMERLIGYNKQLDVISIVGMGGLGKTTLALKVYNNDTIAYHFYIRAWIFVSQAYQKRDLLLGILSSPYIRPNGDIHTMSDEQLCEELYKCLKGNRYLIVMDDIWHTQAWDDLKRSLPNDKNGSKIMLTTRLRDVSLHIKPNSTPYELRFLSTEESWDLFQEKVFQNEVYPPELMKVGKRIVEKCQGLPLAIVVIGGLLARTKKIEYWWQLVADSMGSYIASDPNQCIELSYNHLQNHLKPLFLYLGAFPEDYEIPVFKLICLWIAEGLVEENGDKTLEETAVDYLIGLIGRSLVLISKRSSIGEVKSCRIHDLLRDFCLRKAEEENFMQIINRYEQFSPIIASSSSSSPVSNKVRRLYINSHIICRFPSAQYANAHAVLMHCSFPYSLGLQHFKLLKVLDLRGWLYITHHTQIEQLVHLRYLAFPQLSNELAQSLSSLQNLETFISTCYQFREASVKIDISSMIKLRHLKIKPHVCVDVMLNGSSLMAELQTIYTHWFTCENYLDSLKSTPNLRQLRCTFSNNSIFASSHGLEFLVKLEKLSMNYHGSPSMTRWLDLPASLKKITLSNFGFDWRDISKLARLPKLEVLKLLFNSFRGECWDTRLEESNVQFPKLKFLKLSDLNIVEWNTSKHYFPSLRRLVLNRCEQLKEIPSDIGDIPTLEIIELYWSAHSIAESARHILKDQQDMGNEQLKIFIYPPRL